MMYHFLKGTDKGTIWAGILIMGTRNRCMFILYFVENKMFLHNNEKSYLITTGVVIE